MRPAELCGARWSEIDLERKEWRIPGTRMKMRTPHIVPLSSQAVRILETLSKLNNRHEFVFPGGYTYKTRDKCMSTNALLYALYEMGYKGKLSACTVAI
ncbi:MAG: tyrosine-type recombinase/integrase [Rickettsiales bacterium]